MISLHQIFIKMAKLDFALAKKVFALAVNKKLVDALFFSNFVYVALKGGHLPEATKAINKGLQLKMITLDTINDYLVMMAESRLFAEAKTVFTIAYDRRICNEKTFFHYLLAAICAGQLDEVKTVLHLAMKTHKLHVAVNKRNAGLFHCKAVLGAYQLDSIVSYSDDAEKYRELESKLLVHSPAPAYRDSSLIFNARRPTRSQASFVLAT